MKINYLGPMFLQRPILSLITKHYHRIEMHPFQSIQEYQQQDYDLWLVDCQHVRSVVEPSIKHIYTKVVVLGHYTEQSMQQAFCLDERFSYIAYSHIENELPHYLSGLSS